MQPSAFDVAKTTPWSPWRDRIITNIIMVMSAIIFYTIRCTVKTELAVTSIRKPTYIKQPNRMFPNFISVLIFISVKQPPAFSSHFLCFTRVAAKHRFDCT